MTSALYQAQEASANTIPIVLVEIDLDRCLNTYGSAVAPSTCTATVLADGLRCDYAYGGSSPCQDRANYRKGTKTWRLISDISNAIPESVRAAWGDALLPVVLEVTPAAQEIDQEAGFTRPEKITVKCKEIGEVLYGRDATTSEAISCPPFNADKAVRNTSRRGQFFRRLVAQNPNFKGRAIRLYRGYLTEAWQTTDFELRWWGKLENITFGTDGNPTIHAVDLFDGLETKLPPKIDSVVTAHLTRSGTTLSCTNVSKISDPTLISGAVVVSAVSAYTGRTEYMKVTARNIAGGTVTVVRGYAGSVADPHDAGEQVKEVLAYKDTHAIDFGLDILNRCKIAGSLVDDTQIRAQASWLGPQTLDRIVEEETGGRSLLFEVFGDLYLANLFAAETGKAQLLVMNPGSVTADGAGGATREAATAVKDFPNVLAGTGSSNVNELGRLTHCSVLYAFHGDQASHVSASFDGSAGEGYDRIEIAFNGETSVANYYGEPFRPKLVKSKWLDAQRVSIAVSAAVRWVLRFAHAPLRFQWEAALRDGPLSIGKLVTITTGDIQDGNGDPRPVTCRIVGKRWAGLRGYQFTAQETGFRGPGPAGKGRYAYIGPNTLPDYGAASAAQRVYGFIGNGSNLMGDASDGYYMC